MAGNGDFFLMDVILNRELQRSAVDARLRDPDDVVMVSAKWDKANLEPDCDFKYRGLVAYLPGAGVFYCSRERRPAAVGLPNTLVHHSASWLRISEDFGASPTARRCSFGADGFVRRFFEESVDWVSAWRVSRGAFGTEKCPPRLVIRAQQCSDCEGPRMPPDTVLDKEGKGKTSAICQGRNVWRSTMPTWLRQHRPRLGVDTMQEAAITMSFQVTALSSMGMRTVLKLMLWLMLHREDCSRRTSLL